MKPHSKVISKKIKKHTTRSSKKLCPHNLPHLPLDIVLNIISWLPVKSILASKYLSKAFNNLISDPSFSNTYRTNKSNSECTVFLDDSHPAHFLNMLELDIDQRGNHKISKVSLFKSDVLLRNSTRWGYCNGLFCFLKFEYGLFRFFVANLILGEFIQLPKPVHCNTTCSVYGLGFCQLTNKYKVLRFMTEKRGRGDHKSSTEIFTIGSDQNWRSAYDVKESFYYYYTQPVTVPFQSALHWIVHPDTMPKTILLRAFDMTEEKARTLPLPPEIVAAPPNYLFVSVLLDKICVWLDGHYDEFELWVMDDYGVQASWTKQFILKTQDIWPFTLTPLMVSSGVIMARKGRHKLLYNMKKKKNKKWSRVIRYRNHISCPVPFVPSFISLRNLVPRLMLDV